MDRHYCQVVVVTSGEVLNLGETSLSLTIQQVTERAMERLSAVGLRRLFLGYEDRDEVVILLPEEKLLAEARADIVSVSCGLQLVVSTARPHFNIF